MTGKSSKQNPSDSENRDHARLIDPVVLGRILAEVSERAQPVLQQAVERYSREMGDQPFDPLNLKEAYTEFMAKLAADPARLIDMQVEFWHKWLELWQDSAIHFLGGPRKELYAPEKTDRRFRDPAWEESALFDYIKQSYLLTARWLHKVVQKTEGLDERTREKIDFYTRQFINAISPTNFLMTNPEVLRMTLDSGGENLVRGLENLVQDLERGHGDLRISTTDYKAFELGRNLAVTPGRVVYQNELMQLIQYAPATAAVHRRPLLVIPPWINKYYILDLKPENSFVRWLTEQGHTVFVVSWINPDRDLAQKDFDDYMQEGILAPLDEIRTITGEPDCNVIGYCIGGTLLTMTLAYLAEKKQESRIASATFLTTLVDFSNPGELGLFVDDEQISAIEDGMVEKGYLQASALQRTFSLLRANDLIWSFVINNYLMGKEPFPFDLLYWNDDSTNMPAALQSFYLRRMYKDNLLIQPGGIEICGVPVDITTIATPSYFLSTREDHIAPWKATYAATQKFTGPCIFTLAASGHIAGVINPPASGKYSYWTSSQTPAAPEEWMRGARQAEGSWWPHWNEWAKAFAGDQVPARVPAGGIENAPGSYVKMKAE